MAIGMDEPTGTITTWDHHALLSSPAFIAEMHGTAKASGIDDPLMCVTSGGNHHALLSSEAFLTYYYGQQSAGAITDPVHTVTGIDRAGLVGSLENMTVEDLTFRMLTPHEIGTAMAFPERYIVKGTNRDKVKQYGNAVTPPGNGNDLAQVRGDAGMSISKIPGDSEHDDQVRVFQWAQLSQGAYPELELLHANPNGGLRNIQVARKLKAEGVKSGIPDMTLPVPVGKYHGFYLELKHGKNKPSPEQINWITALRQKGYCVEVAWGWEAAIQTIKDYLEGRLS